MTNKSSSVIDDVLKKRIKRFFVLTLRYVIPGLATVTGFMAWWVTSTGAAQDSLDLLLPPADENPPITIQIEIPAIPIDEVRNGLYPVQGQASCLQDSTKSARALSCKAEGQDLDPCYWIPGDAEIAEVYCFDPVSYKYTAFTVMETLDIWALMDQGQLWETNAVATFIFVKAPDYAFQEYGDLLVEEMDICVLREFESRDEERQIYDCRSGATVQGDVYGELPHLFAEYSSPSGDRVSSEWIKYIIYG